MKKVLIITYYWPPGTGAGVLRWLKLSKYLGDSGWESIVYTPENPEAQGTDHSLEKDIAGSTTVLRRPIKEPYGIYKMLTGRRKSERIQSGFLSEDKRGGFTEKLSVWIRGNLFIPDARRLWVRPSVKYLSGWLEKNPVDAIVSTGPPHSMHLIAMKLKESLGIPWLADFRDPWTQIDFYDKLMLGKRADSKHKELEKKVLSRADKLVTVSENCARGLEKIGGRTTEIVTNGFDPEDFRDLPGTDYGRFIIMHLGSMNADRNPAVLFRVLSDLVKENSFFRDNLRIVFTGKTDFTVKESAVKYGLSDYVRFDPPLPYREALRKAARSAVLLLPLNNTKNVKGITTGKLFDYIALKRPVLCIGPPDGDAARIIGKTNSGLTAGFEDYEVCREILLKFSENFKKRKTWPVNEDMLAQYDRRALSTRIAGLLNQISRS